MSSTPGRLADDALALRTFRQVFDRSPVGMLLADPHSGVTLEINDAACRFLGRSRADLLDIPVSMASPASARSVLREVAAKIVAGGLDSYEIEQRFTRPDGRSVLGLVHLVPVRDHDGAVEVMYAQIVDITDAREREVRLAQDLGDAVWLGRIRAALDDDRLMVFAQPIVDLTTGETVSHELLLRMRGEDGSVIAPGEFLPVAEQYGLIAEIDRWVIRQAVEIAATGKPTEFNLSAHSLSDPSILTELSAAIDARSVDPSLLVVEVTETAFGGAPDAGRRFAEQLAALGCRLALDDFGTGFNSLSHLKHLPADHLKIDIEFVRDLVRSETDARVVRGIVGLAREFEQTTIAEGVEDEATVLVLRELGVDYAQGYLFGRPAPRSGTPLQPTAAGVDADEPVVGSSRIEIVKEMFARFSERDVEGLLPHYHHNTVIRTLRTGELAHRSEPYRGHDGVRQFMRDVDRVWDRLIVTPLRFRLTGRSVFVFGRAEGRYGDQEPLSGILWIFRFDGELVESHEVFRSTAGTDALTPRQMARLAAVAVDGGR